MKCPELTDTNRMYIRYQDYHPADVAMNIIELGRGSAHEGREMHEIPYSLISHGKKHSENIILRAEHIY